MTTVSEVLDLLASRKSLNDEQAGMMFAKLMDGELAPAQAGAFLMGLRAKGEDSTDIAAGVRAGLAHARKVPGYEGPNGKPVIDTCGTGGDGSMSFNCSTATALFLADMGFCVAKHGNRALSSSCGSADALEDLGVPIENAPEEAGRQLDETNFTFLFAPAYHPAFKHVMPIRQSLGIRTVFNFMGPLLNPARPSHQLLGVGDPDKLQLMGEACCSPAWKRRSSSPAPAGSTKSPPSARPAAITFMTASWKRPLSTRTGSASRPTARTTCAWTAASRPWQYCGTFWKAKAPKP